MSAIPASARPRPPARRRRLPLVAAVPFVAAAALLGVIAGAPSEAPTPAPRAEPAPVPTAIAGGAAVVAAPSGWSRTDSAAVPGFPFRHPIALERRSDRLRVTIELLPATAPTMLPAGFPSSPPAVVSLASGQRAWRYAFVRAGGTAALPAESMLVVWAVPTARGVATIACLGPRGTAAPAACDAIAQSLTTPGSAPLRPGPSAAFWSRLPAVLATLDVARVRGRRALAAADRSSGQARASRALSAAHRSAGAALAPLAQQAEVPGGTVRALQAAAGAYGKLGRAARSRWPGRYTRARAAVGAAESNLARALERARTAARAEFAAGRAPSAAR